MGAGIKAGRKMTYTQMLQEDLAAPVIMTDRDDDHAQAVWENEIRDITEACKYP